MILDPKTNKVTPGYDIFTETFGVVVKTQKDTGSLKFGVRLNKLFPSINLEYPTTPVVETNVRITRDRFINRNQLSGLDDTYQLQNYVLVEPLTIYGITTPNLVIGSLVMVRFQDSDIKSAMLMPYSVNETYARNTDVLKVFVPAKKSGDPSVDDNRYLLAFDSDEQFIKLKTSDKNGEEAELDLTLNGAEGLISLSNVQGLSVVMNSKNDSVAVTTMDGGSFVIVKNKLVIDVDDFELNAKKSVKITSKTGDIKIDQLTQKNKKTEWDSDTLEITNKTTSLNTNDLSIDSTIQTQIEAPAIFMDAPVVGISGGLIVPAATFAACSSPPSMMPPPMPGTPSADDSNGLDAAGLKMAAALFLPLNQILTQIATHTHPVPSFGTSGPDPVLSALIPGLSGQIESKKLMG